jgi:hypothetical protein
MGSSDVVSRATFLRAGAPSGAPSDGEERRMSVRLNKDALEFARRMIGDGKVVKDERDDWSEHAPSTDDENAFIEKHGMEEFAKWHLGEDTDETEGTKGRCKFPYGDFRKMHRCAVISGESRAGQYDHTSIEKALKDLLAEIDEDRS